MPKFAANLTMLFTELPFLERFEAAAHSGFRAVEYMFPYAEDVDGIAKALTELRLTQVLFNLPAGDWAAGDRGIAVDPGRREEFRSGVSRAVDLARRFRCTRLNCLVGKRSEAIPPSEQRRCLADNLRYAAAELAGHGITLLVEPVNTYDIPGFFLTTSTETIRVLDEIDAPNARLQYDVYHMQRMEGNLTQTMTQLAGRIGHVQVADAPDRHEPGTGEINFPFVLGRLDVSGYAGYVGLEYRPFNKTDASFGWIETMGWKRS
ncbi:MAG TPA: hydroxypyruvate isomerase [bacterium]|jgi:hydroxypyruvate isomerase|nr:hydroxypyruvate isomerase [bacterium]